MMQKLNQECAEIYYNRGLAHSRAWKTLGNL